jgi:hypothetical protein
LRARRVPVTPCGPGTIGRMTVGKHVTFDQRK